MGKITRKEFMEFFRSEDFHSKVTTDDCIEIFSSVLKGSSDLTPDLLNSVLADYGSNAITIDDNFLETYFEVVSAIVYSYGDGCGNNKVTERVEQQGTGGLYELAKELTVKFEEKYKGREWDGEYLDIIDSFLHKELG